MNPLFAVMTILQTTWFIIEANPSVNESLEEKESQGGQDGTQYKHHGS